MNPAVKVKKCIGRLGRRYGGRPFQAVRKLCYDSLRLPGESCAIAGIWLKRFFRDSEDSRFYAPYLEAPPEERPAKEGIVCMYDGRILHGGLTDRVRGLLTTYREARCRKIPFYIHWDHPFRLEEFLEPATFDWRIRPEEIARSARHAFPVLIQDHRRVSNRLRLLGALFRRRRQTLVYSNADNAKGHYAQLFRELFRPTPLVEREVSRHLEALGGRYWAFSFRFIGLLGDFHDQQKDRLSPQEAGRFIKKVTDEFLKELEAVPEGHRVLVATDSPTFLRLAPTLDPRIYVVEGDLKHLDMSPGDYREAWLKTFVDQFLLMRASRVTLMRTGRMYRSGFPRFAAEVGGVPFVDHPF